MSNERFVYIGGVGFFALFAAYLLVMVIDFNNNGPNYVSMMHYTVVVFVFSVAACFCAIKLLFLLFPGRIGRKESTFFLVAIAFIVGGLAHESSRLLRTGQMLDLTSVKMEECFRENVLKMPMKPRDCLNEFNHERN